MFKDSVIRTTAKQTTVGQFNLAHAPVTSVYRCSAQIALLVSEMADSEPITLGNRLPEAELAQSVLDDGGTESVIIRMGRNSRFSDFLAQSGSY